MALYKISFTAEKTHKVAAIYNDDLNYDNKPYVYDEYLEALSIGINGKT